MFKIMQQTDSNLLLKIFLPRSKDCHKLEISKIIRIQGNNRYKHSVPYKDRQERKLFKFVRKRLCRFSFFQSNGWPASHVFIESLE